MAVAVSVVELPLAECPQRTGGGCLTLLTQPQELHRVLSITLYGHMLAQIQGLSPSLSPKGRPENLCPPFKTSPVSGCLPGDTGHLSVRGVWLVKVVRVIFHKHVLHVRSVPGPLTGVGLQHAIRWTKMDVLKGPTFPRYEMDSKQVNK